MLDTAFAMLGPDSELLTEIMIDLGHKHKVYGVGVEMFPLMREALLHTMKETLGSKFGTKEAQALEEVYNELSSDMASVQKS
eukprot:CAMPEP_0172458066 /NCGR_PEP_ID=MMETSP1065-20121228/25655_1 /TAXON_ID=265537 /ORGANISM="Amphiprora paludosa, Strain CCMP125" /LENGTH=81 /DNA_ID=CAMNT_0013212135 /DNA_START=1 /DNA_END=246 /DNA_ORIENTATION=+